MTAHLTIHPNGRRSALVVLATAAAGALLTVTALPGWAESSPAPTPSATSTSTGPTVTVQDGTVTLTLDAARVESLCERVPVAQKRIATRIATIQGGSDVAGSSAALHKRADAARAAGHDVAAARLDERATRRTDRVTDLERIATRLDAAETAVCGPLAAQLGTAS